jgi:hypothetical protein
MPKFPDPDNNRDDKIAFIVAHRFGNLHAQMKRFGGLWDPKGKPPDTTAAVAAEEKLAAMPDEELQAEFLAVRAEISKAKEARAKFEAAERERHEAALPINIKADFGYWAKLSYWSIEEAVALVLGRDPKHANRKGIGPYLQVSPFARLYEQTLELANRAVGVQQLTNATLPGAFLAWAKRYDIAVPVELEVAVTKYGHFIRDWKTLHDQAAEQRDAGLQRESKLAEAIKILKGHIDEQQRQTKTAAKSAPEGANPPKEADPRELESLRKLSIGLAIVAFGYDPAERRTNTVSEIASDLAQLGIPLSDDTIRKHLKLGAELLPPGWQEGWRKK